MEKSAALIGRAIGKTAREFNALLHEHGYLEGGPGDYFLTEKGKEYGAEKYHHRGNGGYSHYNRDWVTRTWDEGIVTALTADMAADHPPIKGSAEPVGEIEQNGEADQEDEVGRSVWKVAALIGGAAAALVGGAVVATNPRVRRWAGENVTPRAQKVWRTLTRRDPAGTVADHDGDAPSNAVELAAATTEDEISG